MAPSVKYETADGLACEPAAETGESITTAVTAGIRERLDRVQGAVPQGSAPKRSRKAGSAGRLSQSAIRGAQTTANNPSGRPRW